MNCRCRRRAVIQGTLIGSVCGLILGNAGPAVWSMIS